MRTSNSRKARSGSWAVEVIVVLAAITIISLAGYLIYKHQANQKNDSTSTQAQSATASDVPDAPQIQSAADLDKSLSVLDQTDTDSASDTAQLQNELKAFE